MGLHGPKPKTKEEIWIKLKSEVTIDPITNCWLITRGRTVGAGYKVVNWTISGIYCTEYAHRFAYTMTYGKITSEVIMHICDRPNCINPEHLKQGTHGDNVRDKIAKKRQLRGELHPDSRVSGIQVLEILKSSGKTYQQLSNEYGISRGGIHNIKSGRTWNHITGLPKIK